LSPSQAERTEATRAALIEAARVLFAERGYAAVPAEEIVRAAGVTRGALYHHFQDKKDLFRAVHESLEEELVVRIGATIQGEEDILRLLVRGIDAFLDACEDPSFARIALQEAPSVLGWVEWREIDMRYSLGLITGVLRHGMESGAIRAQPVEPLGHLIASAMGEAGILVANGTPRGEVRGPLLAFLDGIRTPT
jgi:AcrR family transcriptional regulator